MFFADEIRKAFVSESSTDPTSMFLQDFNIRFVDYFDKFISWSAGSVCHQLVESPRLLNAESTDTQIFIQLQIRGPRPLSDSLTQEIFVSNLYCNDSTYPSPRRAPPSTGGMAVSSMTILENRMC